MNEDCLFCQIVAGDIPSHTVYEDHDVYAFLDVNPLAKGHTLVIPKAHHERLRDLPESDAAAIGAAIAKLSPAVEDAVDARASSVAYNNGPEAGQEIDHVHAHVVPRFGDDGAGSFHTLFGGVADVDDDEMAALADDIGAGI
ncbi:MAG: HIT domain-containing protein [Haloarculaceae archaeon]